MSGEATKDDVIEIKQDIRDLYNKGNETNKSITNIEVSIARIAIIVEKLPPIPKQPCEWHNKLQTNFEEHIKEQTKSVQKDVDTVKQYAIKLVFDAIKWLSIAGLGVFIGSKF